MSPVTFAAQLEAPDTAWVAWVTVQGWGRRWHSEYDYSAPDLYRWSTLHPGRHGWAVDAYSDPAHSFVPRLLQPEGILDEALDLRGGRTSLGTFSFSLVDGSPSQLGADASHPHGWLSDLLTDLLAHEGPAGRSPGAWDLDDDVLDGTTTTFSIADLTGLQQGMALWIGAEAVWVAAVNVGPGSIDVVRGIYGTQARPHMVAPRGEGRLYDRPRYIWGRTVELWAALCDTRAGHAGEVLPITEAQRVWAGQIDDWEMDGPNVWCFACKPSLGGLDRSIGRERVTGTCVLTEDMASPIEDFMRSGQRYPLAISQASGPGEQGVPPYPADGDGIRRFHARFGDQLIEVEHLDGEFAGVAWGLGGTEIAVPGAAGERLSESVQFWDVLCTDPSFVVTYCVDENGDPSCHPLDLALMLITSTGTPGTNGAWDALPEPWGSPAAVPIAAVNAQSFIDLRDRTSGLLMPDLRIGWDGDRVELRPLLEEQLLGPLGIFLYVDESGLIAAGTISEVYPGQSWPEIDEGDIICDDAGPMVQVRGQLLETVSFQTWRWDVDPRTDEPRQTRTYRSAQVAERLQDGAAEVSREVLGVRSSAAISTLIGRQASLIGRWFTTPPPRISVTVGIHMLATSLTSGVTLTCGWIPNPWTGERGLLQQPAAVVGRGVDLGSGQLRLELILLPELQVGRWAPAATVASWNAGTLTLTLAASHHTRAADPQSEVPVRDALAFAVGDLVMILDSTLAPKSTDVDLVVAAVEPSGANTLRLSKAPSAAPGANDKITLMHWEDGSVPAAAWTARMRQHVAQADAAGDLPDGSDPYVYGGG